MPGKHALLSASSSHRWLNCSPSARLEQEFEDAGMEVYRNTDEEKDAFKNALTDLIKTYEEKLGKELLTDLGYYD